MRIPALVVLLGCAICCSIGNVGSAVAQNLQPGEWRTYTSMRDVFDIAMEQDSATGWAVTSGGAFRFNTANVNEAPSAFRNTNGLRDLDLTAVAADPTGNIYLGSRNGMIELYSEQTKKITHVPDIFQSTEGVKKINHILVSGDRVYIAMGFGLAIMDRTHATPFFLTTINRFGTRPASDSVLDVAEVNGTIYAVQSKALVYTGRNATDPPSWKNVSITGSAQFTTLVNYQNTLYAGTTAGLYRFTPSSSQLELIAGTDAMNVLALKVQGNNLFVLLADQNGSVATSNDGVTFLVRKLVKASGQSPILSLAVAKAGLLYGGLRTGVVADYTQESKSFAPDGPLSSIVADLYYSPSNSTLYSTHNDIGLSFFSPDAEKWQLFSTAEGTAPSLSYRRVFFDSTQQALWAGTIGGVGKGGFTHLTQQGAQLTSDVFDVRRGVPGTIDDFVISGQMTLDRNNTLLGTSYAHNGAGLSFKNPSDPQFQSQQISTWYSYGAIAVDFDNNYWIATENHTQDPSPFGVFYVTHDGRIGGIQGASGTVLPKREVNAVLVDQDDALWCGTNGSGIEIISNISDVNNPNFSGQWYGRDVPLLSQQVVHAIVSDGINNKWIGTDNGVFVVSADGTDSLAHFTTANSPLIDDGVQSIAIDAARGEAYIGTNKGISRVSTIFREGKTDYAGLHIYPNPIVQTSEESPQVFIDGLVNGSTVKIYSLSGRLVATVDATKLGKTATWNGRDETGRQLPSGVYLLSATSQGTTESGQTKFVIIRRSH